MAYISLVYVSSSETPPQDVIKHRRSQHALSPIGHAGGDDSKVISLDDQVV